MNIINEKKNFIFILFYIFSITSQKPYKNIKTKFKCKLDKTKSLPIPASNILPYPKNLKNRRNLDSDGFKDFNIYLDLENFNHEADNYGINDNKKQILIKGMQKAVNILKSLLKVKAFIFVYREVSN